MSRKATIMSLRSIKHHYTTGSRTASIPPRRLLHVRTYARSTIPPHHVGTYNSNSKLARTRQFSNSTCQTAQYNRFGGYNNNHNSQSLLERLLSRAQTYHFVIIGGVLGGAYVYNTDTVEVNFFFFFFFSSNCLLVCRRLTNNIYFIHD